MNLAYLPTPEEFYRARATPRAYVVVDHRRGLHWVPRPVYVPPRPKAHTHTARWVERMRQLWRVEKPPTVRWASSLVVAERVIADAAMRDWRRP